MKKLSFIFIGLLSFLTSSVLFADEASTAAPQQNYMQTIIMLVAAVLFFYFILLRPEQKRRKKLEQQRNSMQKGSRVTAMGIIGTVDKIEEKTVILKMVDGSKIEVVKGAITEVESVEKPQAEGCCPLNK
ncbi:MAG: preprotein translocase subunit YajC [Chlamydiae bacterium]|nr:preprotein translocase subunit YajC [Chlamydiota bacterium]